MTSLSQLETYTNDLATAAKTLAGHNRGAGLGSDATLTDASGEIHRAKRDVLATMARLQVLLIEPSDFIQHLASQVCCPSLFLMSRI